MFSDDAASWQGRYTSWDSQGEFDKKGYLSFPRDDKTKGVLTKVLKSPVLAERMTSQGFWELIIAAYSERHADSSVVRDVLADTFIAFAGGAEPIQIQLSGYLWVTAQEDHRLGLLYLYENLLRGTKLQATHPKLVLNLTVRDTTFRFFPTMLQLSESAAMQGAVSFAMAGYASRYKVLPSQAMPADYNPRTVQAPRVNPTIDEVRTEKAPTQKVVVANKATGSPKSPTKAAATKPPEAIKYLSAGSAPPGYISTFPKQPPPLKIFVKKAN